MKKASTLDAHTDAVESNDGSGGGAVVSGVRHSEYLHWFWRDWGSSRHDAVRVWCRIARHEQKPAPAPAFAPAPARAPAPPRADEPLKEGKSGDSRGGTDRTVTATIVSTTGEEVSKERDDNHDDHGHDDAYIGADGRPLLMPPANHDNWKIRVEPTEWELALVLARGV